MLLTNGYQVPSNICRFTIFPIFLQEPDEVLNGTLVPLLGAPAARLCGWWPKTKGWKRRIRIGNLGTLHGSEITNLENKGQFMIVYQFIIVFPCLSSYFLGVWAMAVYVGRHLLVDLIYSSLQCLVCVFFPDRCTGILKCTPNFFLPVYRSFVA